MKYAQLFNRKNTHQMNPIPGSNQVRNSAGGFAWAVTPWALLDRFLILGSEDGTYYVSFQKLTQEHAKNVLELIKQDGPKVVQTIVNVSKSGRAPKNDPAIFALALCASVGDEKTRSEALNALPQVCRTGTHLFEFAAVCDGLRGWGRGLRSAVGRWYNGQPEGELAYQLVKYMQREGWSHRDLLRLAHPKPASEGHKALYKWVVDDEITGEIPLVKAVERLKSAGSVAEAAGVIREARVPREAVPTELLTQAEVWEALLEDMPLTAMLRNLGNMSKCGLLTAGSEAAAKVVAALNDEVRLRKARVHPIAILNALSTYASGRGLKGNGTWLAVPKVIDALDKAFYASFSNVTPTGKRIVVGLDVSGSMAGTQVTGLASLECRQAAGAMALVNAAVENAVTFMAFDTDSYALSISGRQRLDDVTNLLARTGGGGTDCALPIKWALNRKIKADAIVIYTDSETWYGTMHPAQAMEKYRSQMGLPTKLVVVAMAANRFTVGDTSDPLTMTVVGFDASVPEVIADFVRN